MRRLVLTRLQWDTMRRQSEAGVPLETCGLLAGVGDVVRTVIPVPNALNSPTRYRFSPEVQLAAFEQVDQTGLEMLAIYHSHPRGPVHPSPTDVKEAYYPVVYVIWSLQDDHWQARGFWIENGAFDEVALEIVEQLQ